MNPVLWFCFKDSFFEDSKIVSIHDAFLLSASFNAEEVINDSSKFE